MKCLHVIMLFFILGFLTQCKQSHKKDLKFAQSSSIGKKTFANKLIEDVDYCTSCNDDIKLALIYPDSVTSITLSTIDNKDFASISRLTNLEMINITNSPSLNFDKFFKQISTLAYLRQVSIQGCSIHALPASVTLLKNLESLTINDTLNVPFSGFSNLTSLKKLGIICTWDFCKGIEKLKNLNNLDLWIVNRNAVPREVFLLPNLKKIRLCGNIIYIPSEIKRLKNIDNLIILTKFSEVKSVAKKGYIRYVDLKEELPKVSISISYF